MKYLAMLAVCTVSMLRGQNNQSFIKDFPLLAALDTDHDGVISAAEIAGAPAVLHSLDRNEDGKLEAEECAEGGEHGPSSSDMVKTLMAFDKNGDGKLERSEMPERMQGLFDRGDLNKDGVLTVEEIRKLAQAEQASRPKEQEGDPATRQRMEKVIMRVVPVLAALEPSRRDFRGRDAERSRRLEDPRQERRRPLTDAEVTPDWLRVFVAQGMVQFDADGDGRISREEADAPKARPFRGTILAADRNHDGYATEDELIVEVRLRADANHDGVVTQEEIQRALQSGALAKEEVHQQ